MCGAILYVCKFGVKWLLFAQMRHFIPPRLYANLTLEFDSFEDEKKGG